jgi:methyl-accepting chemotaxis protein
MKETLASVSEAAAGTGDGQASEILEATSVIEEMGDSIKGMTENTERLSVSAEESSSSILEMGATVEEVSGNMEGLSHSVEESVSSVEQMTSAIREVARNVEGLSEVAEQTKRRSSRWRRTPWSRGVCRRRW